MVTAARARRTTVLGNARIAMKATRPWSAGATQARTWFNELVCEPESNAPLSVNDTLARGMTGRFIAEMRERSVRCLLRCAPPTIEKRAAAYRAQCRWLEQTIPADLMILVHSVGPQDGKVKHASRFYMYWDVALEIQRLTAVAARIDARKLGLLEYAIAVVSEHALHRLFRRLNTIDHRAVLRELNPGIDALFCLMPGLLAARIAPVLTPTPSGALVFRYAGPEEEMEEEAPFIAVTWISDERMRESPVKLAAVQEARAERGVLGVVDEGFIVISEERLARSQDIASDEEQALRRLFRPSAGRAADKRQRSAKS